MNIGTGLGPIGRDGGTSPVRDGFDSAAVVKVYARAAGLCLPERS